MFVKKIMKQSLVLSLLLIVLILPYFVFAKTPLEGLENAQKGTPYADANEFTLTEIAGTLVATLLSFLGVIFIALMVYGGYLWMTDQGNEEQVSKAKSIIKNSIIGLVIVISSYAIYMVVETLFEKTISEPTNGGEQILDDTQGIGG